jgi:hypothetical protein
MSSAVHSSSSSSSSRAAPLAAAAAAAHSCHVVGCRLQLELLLLSLRSQQHLQRTCCSWGVEYLQLMVGARVLLLLLLLLLQLQRTCCSWGVRLYTRQHNCWPDGACFFPYLP